MPDPPKLIEDLKAELDAKKAEEERLLEGTIVARVITMPDLR